MADLSIVAPHSERSASGLAVTVHDPVRLEKILWEGSQSTTEAWKVSGTPADCVKLALNIVLKNPPDLIVAGINRGDNSGRNVLYSGTVAAAIEGVLHNVQSIAFSCFDFFDPDYLVAEKYIPHIVSHLLQHPLPAGTLLNVNFPSRESEGVKGIKLTKQGKGYWKEAPDERKHPHHGTTYYWMGAELATFPDDHEGDVGWLKKGYVTCAPIQIDMTNYHLIQERKNYFEELFFTI